MVPLRGRDHPRGSLGALHGAGAGANNPGHLAAAADALHVLLERRHHRFSHLLDRFGPSGRADSSRILWLLVFMEV